jgi:hypothetical protein
MLPESVLFHKSPRGVAAGGILDLAASPAHTAQGWPQKEVKESMTPCGVWGRAP